MKKESTVKGVVVWFRQDLRLQDNPALQAAIESGKRVIPVYILDEAGEGEWPPGQASRWWLHHALEDLDNQLRKLGGNLLLKRGDSFEVLKKIFADFDADALYWNRRYEPHAVVRDSEIKVGFRKSGFEVQSFNSSLLHEPQTIAKKDGTPYRVFTAYWKQCLKQPKKDPQEVDVENVLFSPNLNKSDTLESLILLPKIAWDDGFYSNWDPTVAGARELLKSYVSDKLEGYDQGRDVLDLDGTSRLSPFLHFGQIGPRQIWAKVVDLKSAGLRRFLAEMGWREFSYHLLFHFPGTPTEPLRPEFSDFPWQPDEAMMEAWQKGMTGFPVVDAGMRQLWETGWMHNRARMITASFLVKHLLQPWQEGARWFWDTLVDADLASNTQGWQWTAGCGADASPYFRVFNPILQGEKFDNDGRYVRRWVPELSKMPDEFIHQPWKAKQEDLTEAGIQLGSSYPKPVIAHSAGRARALKAYGLFKAANETAGS